MNDVWTELSLIAKINFSDSEPHGGIEMKGQFEEFPTYPEKCCSKEKKKSFIYLYVHKKVVFVGGE